MKKYRITNFNSQGYVDHRYYIQVKVLFWWKQYLIDGLHYNSYTTFKDAKKELDYLIEGKKVYYEACISKREIDNE